MKNKTQKEGKYKSAEEFIKAKGLDPESVFIKDGMKFIVENSAGEDAVLTEIPIASFGKVKFETLNQRHYEAGRPITDPIEATLERGEYIITDGANRFTQAIANGDKTIPVILKVTSPIPKDLEPFVKDRIRELREARGKSKGKSIDWDR
jgi:hypothetical protein